MKNSLSFLHLSDIHFTRQSGNHLDLDKDLRNQLLNDIVRVVLPQVEKFDGLLLTGDVAFSGSPSEYETAVSWIEEICRAIGCQPHQVWVVPGNHDVDRDLISKSKILNDIHSKIKATELCQIDRELVGTLQDDSYGKVLLDPLAAYIKFASRYGCQFSVQKPFWQSEPIIMNDGSELCFRGLTSTLVSDEFDDNENRKLVLGISQVQMSEESDRTYVTLCHHPSDWLKDADNVLPYICSRTKVALFGHKHVWEIFKKDSVGGSTIFIHGGAVHPERRDILQPYYNAVSFRVDGAESERTLIVTIHSRRWNSTTTRFEADAPDSRQFSIILEPWVVQTCETEMQMRADKVESNLSQDMENAEISRVRHPFNPREFTYKFLSLPYHEIVSIGVEMDLLKDIDEGVQNFVLTRRFSERAIKRNQLPRLIKLVELQYNNLKGGK